MIRKYLYGGPGYFLGGVTAKDLDEGTKKVARGFNWLMGKVGDTFNTVVTAGASSDFGQTSPFALMNRKAIAKGREQVRQKAKKAIEENAVYVSPSSHVAAWTQGSWNPKVGALFLASDPRIQALGAVGDLAALKYTPKAVKVGKNLSLILKKRSVISKVNKELKKGIKENSVLESYNEVPANKDIGTAYDYLDFLDNIYPNSKLNATFYHGGPKGIAQFKSAKELGSTNKGINSGTKDYGIYLADDKSLALYYANTHKKANRHLYNIRVNVQNPMRYETNSFYMDKFSGSENLRFTPAQITLKWYDKLNLKNYDGIYHTKSKNVFEDGELVMLDGNNIHIMGTPEESLMFRTWKLNPLYSSKPLLEEISLTPEQYDRSFLNYAKASKSGLMIAGLSTIPLSSILYSIYWKPKVANTRKSKAANSRKWKHLNGGILEDRSAEKLRYDEWNLLSALDKLKRNFNIARQFISESPRLENVYNATLAMLGEYNPLNPYLITGVAPSVGRTPKIRKQSVSDINNKGLLITKKFNTSVKNGMTYEDGDARHLNRGPRSYDALARERARIFLVKYRAGTPEFKLYEKLTKSLAKKTDIGASPSVLNNIKKLMNDILDNLIALGYVL